MIEEARISYTYLILFYDGSFYYGVRLCPKDKTPWQDTEYVGSPVTHKDKWNEIKFIKFVLETFDSYKKAQEKEKELVRTHLNNPLCLNENIGGIFSILSKSKGGKIGGKVVKENGILNKLIKNNIESGHYKKIGAIGGKIGGKKNLESGHLKKLSENKAKDFIIKSPDGNIISGNNITKFCKEYNLHQSNITGVLNGKIRSCKGWTLP